MTHSHPDLPASRFVLPSLASAARSKSWKKPLAVLVLCVFQLSVGIADDSSEKIAPDENTWVHGGFDDFLQGQFDGGGANLYVNTHGIIETIHRLDVNNDGYVDLVLANSHDNIERGPTDVFTSSRDRGPWLCQRMSGDSGWCSRIVDLDNDGHADLIVVNSENGVTSKLSSYVYWGGPDGVGHQRTDLLTVGAYDVAVVDLNRDGHLDLIFPSAWEDHHNSARPRLAHVYLGGRARKFRDASQQYGIHGIGAMAIGTGDFNQDGFVDLVLANYRERYDRNTESFVYWGTPDGVDVEAPLCLPTNGPLQVLVDDLNQDGKEDLVFSGGNQVRIYWNKAGNFDPAEQTLVELPGYTSQFVAGVVRCAAADTDGDGKLELITASNNGVQFRNGANPHEVLNELTVSHADWATACDLDNDGRKDLVVSRYSDGTAYDTDSFVFWNGPLGFSTDRATRFPTAGAVGNTTGDLDGDGRPEVVFNSTMSGHIATIHNYIYLGNQRAEYSTAQRLELPTDGSDACTVADLDLDGYPEVIFAETLNSEEEARACLRIYRGGPGGPAIDRSVVLPANSGLQDVRVADFNRDGYLDLLGVSQVYDDRPETLAKSSSIFYGSKDGFSPTRQESIGMMGCSGSVADVNKDGHLDLLFLDKRGYVLIYLGGNEGFSKDRTWQIPCVRSGVVGAIDTADLNQDGWLDLIVTTMGHYTRLKDSLYVFYGSPEGYTPENAQELLAGYSPGRPAVADFNRDGNLDLIITGYSSPTERVIPAQLFWGNGKSLDLDHPVDLPTESSTAVLPVDLNRDGWLDLFLACHRNDVGHRVDSLIYWSGPDGFSANDVTRLPGLGPHGTTPPNYANGYTREPCQSYVSPPVDMTGWVAKRIHWTADVVPPAELKFQIRWAPTQEQLKLAEWTGPDAEHSYFKQSGQRISPPADDAQWFQYRAVFISPYGCRSPRLREVRVDRKPRR